MGWWLMGKTQPTNRVVCQLLARANTVTSPWCVQHAHQQISSGRVYLMNMLAPGPIGSSSSTQITSITLQPMKKTME